ncbi:hypothetical protein CK203_035447 [Vitis vinifera]|uniref:Retrotransposon gag domain-containing protein n=1 Tax=Vitis vinifera TaxID=29760 RepID=A0A438I3V5_VITVI|nr:hypothetical protein CK203_035447 [Vitis vinifera]
MASLRDTILGLGQRIDGHQAQPLPILGSTLHDSTTPPPPPPSGPSEPTIQLVLIRIEQRMRSLHVSDGIMGWDGYDDMPVAALLLSSACRTLRDTWDRVPPGAAQRCLPHWTLRDVGHGLIWDRSLLDSILQYYIVDISRRELEALRQGPDETVTSFIFCWREKIAHIIDRPSEHDQISMIMRSLQPRFARHLMGFPQTDFGSLVQALYALRMVYLEFMADSSPSDSKGKK